MNAHNFLTPGSIVEVAPGGLLLVWPDTAYRYPGMIERNRFEVVGRQEKMLLVKFEGVSNSQVLSVCPYSVRQLAPEKMITPGFGAKITTACIS